MQTLYVDVYFLINFTVDVLALHFASYFLKIPISVKRLVISGIIGALYAVLGVVFLKKSFLMYVISPVFLVIMILIATRGVGLYRKIKYAISFLLFEIVIGGTVYYAYCLLNRFLSPYLNVEINGERKNLLIFAIIVLLSIGILKMALYFFETTRSEKNIKLSIVYNNTHFDVDALIDSGNLAIDPFDKTPVMLVNKRLAVKIFGYAYSLSDDFEKIENGIKKRIHIIPINFGGNSKLLCGIKADGVYAHSKRGNEKISVIIAIDCEIDNYGGYSALVPLSALEDII